MNNQRRLNLRSDIYKNKKSKSPFTSKHGTQYSQHSTIRKKFQNVCCPNCRYLFQVIREEVWHNREAENHWQTKMSQFITISTQTNEQQLKIKSNRKNQKLFTQIKQQSLNRSKQKLQRKQTDELLSNLYRQQIKYPKTPSKTPKNSSKFTNTGKVKQELHGQVSTFPSKEIYTRQKNQSQLKIKTTIFQLKNQKKHEQKPEEDKSLNELIDRIYLSEEIKQLLNYNIDDVPKISMPSYCKMLLYDFLQRKDRRAVKNNVN